MKRIEIYLNGEKGGYHTIIIVQGHHRQQHDITSQVPENMYGEAVRLIEGDAAFEQRARIFDPSRRVVRNGDMTVNLANLRLWAKPPKPLFGCSMVNVIRLDE